MLEKLKEYFETTPRERVLKDWADSGLNDHYSITTDDFIKETQRINSRRKAIAWFRCLSTEDRVIAMNEWCLVEKETGLVLDLECMTGRQIEELYLFSKNNK